MDERERLKLIVKSLLHCGQKATVENVSRQFCYETKRKSAPLELVLRAIKGVKDEG